MALKKALDIKAEIEIYILYCLHFIFSLTDAPTLVTENLLVRSKNISSGKLRLICKIKYPNKNHNSILSVH